MGATSLRSAYGSSAEPCAETRDDVISKKDAMWELIKKQVYIMNVHDFLLYTVHVARCIVTKIWHVKVASMDELSSHSELMFF